MADTKLYVISPSNDLEYTGLISQGATPGQINDMQYQVLSGAGYTGALPDMLQQFWAAGGLLSSGALSELGTGGAIPGTATFTRTGTAWAIGSDGGVDSYAQDTPRYQYDLGEAATGLLIEGARTNLVTYSNYDAGAWTAGSVTVSSAFGTAPDGTTTTFQATPTGANNNVFQVVAIAASPGGEIFSSTIWAKDQNSSSIFEVRSLFTGTTTKNTAGSFDLVDGSISSAHPYYNSIEARASWYRIMVSETTNAGNNALSFRNRIDSGVWVTPAELWNAQIELGAFPTSPIITNGSIVTRNAETCTDAISGSISDVTLIANGVAAAGISGNQTWLQVDDGTDDNRVVIRRESTGNVWARRYSGGVLQSSIDLGAVANGANALIEAESTASTFRARINGGTVLTNNVGTHPSGLTTVRYGSSVAGEHMFGILLGSDQTTGTKVESGTLT